MSPIDRLFVLWRAPADGTRHVIGELWKEPGGGFAFAYHDELPHHVPGFMLLTEFPQPRPFSIPYRAPYLFSTFLQRIPSVARADRADLMRSWGVVNADDLFEVLARSGGVQLTDRVELAEYRPVDDDLHRPLEFRVAGATHYDDGGLVAEGDQLDLRREPENIHDSQATVVLVHGGKKLGYVPRQYSDLVARLLDRGDVLRAVAVRRLLLGEGGRWVVRASRA